MKTDPIAELCDLGLTFGEFPRIACRRPLRDPRFSLVFRKFRIVIVIEIHTARIRLPPRKILTAVHFDQPFKEWIFFRDPVDLIFYAVRVEHGDDVDGVLLAKAVKGGAVNALVVSVELTEFVEKSQKDHRGDPLHSVVRADVKEIFLSASNRKQWDPATEQAFSEIGKAEKGISLGENRRQLQYLFMVERLCVADDAFVHAVFLSLSCNCYKNMRKKEKYLQITEEIVSKIWYNDLILIIRRLFMELSLLDRYRKKRLTLIYAVLIFGIALFYAAVCTPVHIWAYSNILVSETVFLIVWDGVVTAVNYLFYWVSFAFMLYFFARFTAKYSKSVLFVYLGASAFLYLANLLSSCIVNGFADFVLNDLLDVLMYTALDAAQMAFAALLAWWALKPAQEHARRVYLKARGDDPEATLKMPRFLPFTRLFDLKNPLMRSAFLASAISAVFHIASRIRYDIFFGAPVNTADLLWMIFAYVSELIAWLVGYFIMILLLNHLDIREGKKE